VTVQVASANDTVDAGTVEVYDGSTLLGTATVSSSGVATITLPAYKHKGAHTLTVRYLGTALFQASQTTVGFTVGK
jgi:5'-nucleotidase